MSDSDYFEKSGIGIYFLKIQVWVNFAVPQALFIMWLPVKISMWDSGPYKGLIINSDIIWRCRMMFPDMFFRLSRDFQRDCKIM